MEVIPIEKRNRITGGLVTQDFLESSPTVLQRTPRGIKGAQQVHTPPPLARFIARCLVGDNRALESDQVPTCDPVGAGAGNLLEPYNVRYGVEIDTDRRSAAYTKVIGDCQPVCDVGHTIGLRFPRIVANPPWGLQWYAFGHRGRSAQVALAICCKLLHPGGMGAIIIPQTDYIASLGSHGNRVLAVVHLPEGTFENVSVEAVVAFFTGGPIHYGNPDVAEYDSPPSPLAIHALIRNNTIVSNWNPDEIGKKFALLQEEFRRRARNRGRPVSAVTITGKKRSPRLSVYISPVDRIRIDQSGDWNAHELLESVRRNHGQSAWQLCFDKKQWRQLLDLCKRLDLPIDASVHETYAELCKRAERVYAPMLPIEDDVLRVAALRDSERIVCKKDDAEHGFRAGIEYAIDSRSIERTEVEERLVPVKSRDAKTGRLIQDWENVTFHLESRGLEFTLSAVEGMDSSLAAHRSLQVFDERDRDNIRWLVEHFELPEVRTIDQMFPEEFEAICRRVRRIVDMHDIDGQFRTEFLDAFQIADVARMVMKGGSLLAWEQGLGKTIAAMLYAKAAGVDKALFVVPQDLIPQWQEAAEKFFMTDLRPIRSGREARRVRERLQAGHAGWYVTHYELLSQGGKIEEFSHVQWDWGEDGWVPLARFGRETVELSACPVCGMTETPDDQHTGKAMRLLIAKHGRRSTERYIEQRRDKARWPDQPLRKVQWVLKVDGGRNPRLRKAYCTRCGYTHLRRRLKPAYYPLRDVFDLIVVDEGTRIKTLGSQMSQAIQGMRSPHRLLLTGTPIKNYIPDMFALMWWGMGDNSPRFPFSREGGKAKFEKEFSVIEYRMDGDRKKGRKVLPRLSNVIGFWRLANAGCIRRTKKNAGIPVVSWTWHDLRAPFGTRQAREYRRWIDGFVDWFCRTYDLPICEYPELVRRDQALLGQYAKLRFMCTLPGAERQSGIEYGSAANFTPKNLAVIHKACALVDQGRKIVIFSAVREFPFWIANILNRMGYPALSIVRKTRGGEIETASPRERSRIVDDFKRGSSPILCATMQSLNLGFNLDCASAAIINGLPWDHATMSQSVNRVHRITSLEPVDIYVAITCCNDKSDDFLQGASLDQKARKLLREKAQCASLALDGALPETDEETVDLRQFMREVEKAWKEPINTLDERHLKQMLQQPRDLLSLVA